MNTSCIDLITYNPNHEEYILIISETVTEDDLFLLQEKINNYLSFALDGPFIEMYPEAEGKDIRIRIDLMNKPDEIVLEFLHAIGNVIRECGLAYEWEVIEE